MIDAIQFPNVGFLKTTLTPEQVQPIIDEINEIKDNFLIGVEANQYLVGNIEKEYGLFKCKNHLDQLLREYVATFENTFNYLSRHNTNSENRPLALNHVWVNFQKKHEFNPLHNHSGVFSFVIWIKIPFKIQNELDQSPGSRGKSPVPGHFAFYYTSTLGDICHYSLPVDESWENTLLLFPASMNHAVYPFYTSDDYRISVSGNIVFNL